MSVEAGFMNGVAHTINQKPNQSALRL